MPAPETQLRSIKAKEKNSENNPKKRTEICKNFEATD